MKKESVILGIDPGTRVMGYGIIRVKGNHAESVGMGVIRMIAIADPYRRMSHILEKMYELLDTYRPDYMAIEAPFTAKTCNPRLNWAGHRSSHCGCFVTKRTCMRIRSA